MRGWCLNVSRPHCAGFGGFTDLLLPEIIDLPEDDCDRLAERAGDLAGFGLVLERFGPGAIAVRETPALLGETDVTGLVRDLADEIAEWDSTGGLARPP
jgi:DNA mismatch repair protein MutL